MQYYSKHNIVFLFKCYWYDITDRRIRVNLYHGLVKINLKARPRNVNDVFIFIKQCQQVYYIYTHSFRKDCLKVDWLSIVNTKPRGCVEVVQYKNDKLTMGDDVFQLGELVDPYQVPPSNDFKKNSNFHITNNIFVDVDTKKLNNVLSSSGHPQVDEDDNSNEINIEDCDGDEHESIEKKKTILIKLHNMNL